MNTADSEAWLDSFSLRAYQPMLRLAAGGDPAFLSGTGTSQQVKRYRREQRRLLREYLGGLSRDFQRLYSIAAAKERVESFPNRAAELCEGQLSFIFGVLWIEGCLAVQALFPQAVDLGPLFESVQTLERETRERVSRSMRM